MKTTGLLGIIVLAASLTACDVERTSENSVEVSTDTAATAAVAEDARDAAQATETAVRDAAQATETAVREGAQKTGTALEEAGKEIQEHSKPGNQP